MGTIKNKTEENLKLNNDQSKIIESIREIGLFDTIEELNLEIKYLESMISKSSQFKKAYYEAIGLSIKQVDFLKMFKKQLCNISKTCRSIGINRKTYYRWLETNLVFSNEIEELRESLLDDIESIIHEKIFKNKDTAMIIYYSKAKLKDRGYSEKPLVHLKNIVNTNIEDNQGLKKMSIEEMDERISYLKEKLAQKKIT